MEKEPKSISEQLDILKSRGIDLDDENEYNKATDILTRIGYYKLINGYKGPFLAASQNGEDHYKEHTTISEIHSLYYFDNSLREIMLRHILPVEVHVKSLISLVISEKYGQDNYLKYSNFNGNVQSATIITVISSVYRQIATRESDPSIKHYLSKYGFIPMWVLNNILTMGQISKIYSIMKTKDRQDISRKFKVQDNVFENILMRLTDVRNACAHGNRLYCLRTKKPLVDTPVHRNLGLVKRNSGSEYQYGKRDLFAAIIALKYMLSNNEFKSLIGELSTILNRLKPHLHVITVDDVLSEMGFPSNWQKIRDKQLKSR